MTIIHDDNDNDNDNDYILQYQAHSKWFVSLP